MRNKIFEGKLIKKKQSGFSYIEVLVSLFMVSIALVLMHAAHNALLLNRTAQHRELALRIASSQIEVLRNTPLASLPNSGSFAHSLLTELPSGVANMTIGNFNARTWEVSVVVTWREPHSPSTQQSVELATLMTENGM
jgi:Tfp pilus assembly protein PilV